MAFLGVSHYAHFLLISCALRLLGYGLLRLGGTSSISCWQNLRQNARGFAILVSILQLKPCERMILLVRSRIRCLQLLLLDGVYHVALLAKVKIEAVLAFVANAGNRVHLATMALHVLAYLLPWLNNQLNSVGLLVMASDLDLVKVILPCEIAILAHTEMNTISADKAGANNGSHVAAHAFVVIVSREAVGQEWQFNAGEVVVLADHFCVMIQVF